MNDVTQCRWCKGYLFSPAGHRHCATSAARARHVAAAARNAQNEANLASPDHWTPPEEAHT